MLEHDPEKVEAGFPKRSCFTKEHQFSVAATVV